MQPDEKGGEGKGDEAEGEARCVPLCGFGKAGLLRQGAVKQAADVGKAGLFTRFGGADDEGGGSIEGAGGHAAAGGFGNGQVFAGEHGFVCFAFA